MEQNYNHYKIKFIIKNNIVGLNIIIIKYYF